MDSSAPPIGLRHGLRRLSLRTRLLLLVVSAALPLMLFGLWRQYYEYQLDVAATGRRTLDFDRGLARRVEQELRSHIEILQVLSLSNLLVAADFAGFQARAEKIVAEHFPGNSVLLLDAAGRRLLSTAVPYGRALPPRQDLRNLQKMFATGQPSVSEYFIDPVTQAPAIVIDVPVRNDRDQVIYSLSINVPASTFETIIQDQKPPASWVISILDQGNRFIVRTHNPNAFVGQMAGPELLRRMQTSREGILEGTSRDGIALVAAYYLLDKYGWTVTIGVPRAEIIEPALAATTQMLLAGAILVALSLGLALIMARQISRPFAVLRRLAAAASRDQGVDPVSTGLSEADEVADALRLAEERRLQSESKERERSAQLEAANLSLANEVTVRRRAELRTQAQLARLNLLQQITHAIGDRQDLESIFRVVLRNLEDQLPIDFGCFCLHDPASPHLSSSCVGRKNTELGKMVMETRIGIQENSLARCLKGELVYEAEIRHSMLKFLRLLAQGGMMSLVVAPLQVESQVFGVLFVARRDQGFSSTDCEFLRQLSAHVALAANQVQLYGSLQQAYEDLRQTQQSVMQQERLRALGQMASGIAHDINNALSPASLFAEDLLDTEPNLSSHGRRSLEIVQRAVDDVANTVARMNDFYRPREANQPLVPAHVNQAVQQIVDLTRARWSDMALQRGIVIQVLTDLASDLPHIMAIESEIREALTNLVLNAVDAMPQGGVLTIKTTSVGPIGRRHVQVDVSDNGDGMDEETRRRCLEPFFSTKGSRGTGLGLAMVYGIMQRHGGELEIVSAPGQGTRISLIFPVTEVAVTSVAPMLSRDVLPALRLLIIDDDPLLVKSLRDTLERDGHEVVSANDGQDGINIFLATIGRGENFAAVITDLGMPYVDGSKVASTIKRHSPVTPVILLTGWGRRLAADDEMPPHVDRVLSKPPKMRELRQALQQLCTPMSE